MESEKSVKMKKMIHMDSDILKRLRGD